MKTWTWNINGMGIFKTQVSWMLNLKLFTLLKHKLNNGNIQILFSWYYFKTRLIIMYSFSQFEFSLNARAAVWWLIIFDKQLQTKSQIKHRNEYFNWPKYSFIISQKPCNYLYFGSFKCNKNEHIYKGKKELDKTRMDIIPGNKMSTTHKPLSRLNTKANICLIETYSY